MTAPQPTYTLWYDRIPGTINGFLTLQDQTGHKLFERLPARSGQRGYENTNWVRGCSPIPYTPSGKTEYIVHLDKMTNGPLFPKTRAGIGQFIPISNHVESERLISPSDPALLKQGLKRLDIGLHPENAYVGSEGCVVLLWETRERKQRVKALFDFLTTLKANGVKQLKLVVL